MKTSELELKWSVTWRYFLFELLYCNLFILNTPRNSCRSHIASYCQDLLYKGSWWRSDTCVTNGMKLRCCDLHGLFYAQTKSRTCSEVLLSARYAASSSVISDLLKTSWHFACRLSLVSSLYAGWYKEGIVGGRGHTGRGFGRGRWGGNTQVRMAEVGMKVRKPSKNPFFSASLGGWMTATLVLLLLLGSVDSLPRLGWAKSMSIMRAGVS